MLIEFDESTHTYFVDGDVANISVTELLAKHGLAPDYSGVNKKSLAYASKRGKEVHKDLENIFNKKDYTPTTKQGEQFAKWVKENVDCGVGEQMLAYNYKSMIFVGTADVMAIMKDGAYMVGDHKNTSKFHREYVSWQVSLLDYFARKLGTRNVNGKQIIWKGATKFYCFHYDPKIFEMRVYELDKVPDREIERLLECEYQGEIYTRQELAIDKRFAEKFEKAEQYVLQVQETLRMAEENARKYREEMLSYFEQQGIKSWETENIKVTYVPQMERLSVDSKALKEKYPNAYSECQKLNKVKAQLRIKKRGDENEC